MNNPSLSQELRSWSLHQVEVLYQVVGRHNGIACQVYQRIRGPQVMVFRLVLAQPKDLNKILGLGEQIGLALGVDNPRVVRKRAFVDVEIPLDSRYHVPISARALVRKGRLWLSIGKTLEGQPVNIKLDGTLASHWLVAALTGGGKTTVLRLLVWELADQNPPVHLGEVIEPGGLQLLIIDGKGGTNFRPFGHLPHLPHPIIADAGEATRALAWALAELEIRKKDGRKLPRLVIVIDEVAEVLEVAGDKAAEAIRRITALGRELGVHIILATQHPTAGVLGGSLAKANLGFRLVGRVADARASALATGQKDLGAHLLRGNGDFLAVVGDMGHRVQTALVMEEDIERLPRTDQIATLPLVDLNLDRALDVGLAVPDEEIADSRRAEIITPQQVATALAFQRGNTWLCHRLGIGAAKAKRIREEWEFPILTELRQLGFQICSIDNNEVGP